MSDLLKQWQSDCERLTKPHLQWEFLNLRKGEWEKIKDCVRYQTINQAFEFGREFRRIDSLALPFDFEDAVNGGKVELSIGFGEESWIYGDFQGKD